MQVASSERAIEKFKNHTARVAVLGLGYAGLPLAFAFAEAGFPTVGLDIDEQKIVKLRRAESYIGHIPLGAIAKHLRDGKFEASTDLDLLKDCDAAIICVPTPLGERREPDLTYVEKTTASVAERLHPGQLVVLESTTYPGTTDEVLLPILTRRNLTPGTDFFLAYSPEREDPANPDFGTRKIPKLVGGLT